MDETHQKNVLLTTLKKIQAWASTSSLWTLPLGLSCCGAEMRAAFGSRYDIERFRCLNVEVTPSEANLMIVAGTITELMSKDLISLYKAMATPKYVIALGGCAIDGGPYATWGTSVVKGADQLFHVDLYIPGCPPRPEALIDGILKLQGKKR